MSGILAKGVVAQARSLGIAQPGVAVPRGGVNPPLRPGHAMACPYKYDGLRPQTAVPTP